MASLINKVKQIFNIEPDTEPNGTTALLKFKVYDRSVQAFHIHEPEYQKTKSEYPENLYAILEKYNPLVGAQVIIYEYKTYFGRPCRWEPQTVYELTLNGWKLKESKVKV